MSKSIVLACKGLSKTYQDVGFPIPVLQNVNFEVANGEMIAIMGASGSGKSTLLHCLGGLDKADSGEVMIANHNMTTLSEIKKGQLRNSYLGFIYQFHHLLPEFSALENVCMPLLIARKSIRLSVQLAKEMIEHVGLKNRCEHRVGELSGGERQRIAIARALVNNPHCVLADEPTGNLDQHNALQIFELMRSLNQQLQTSFIIVTHNEQIAQMMDRILILSDGEVHTR